MAYADQKLKERISPRVKAICQRYGIRGSLSIRNHSTLVLTISSGRIDFFENFNRVVAQQPRYNAGGFTPAKGNIGVNVYHYQTHFDGTALKCMTELVTAMMDGNHDRSDIQTDYFDVGWYVDVNIGKWNKPYLLTA